MPVAETSIEANYKNMMEGITGNCEAIVFTTVCKYWLGLSRSQIAEKTGLSINNVSGRVNELIAKGKLVNAGTKFDPKTNRRVNIVRVNTEV